jgi:uncharacterized membrane protein
MTGEPFEKIGLPEEGNSGAAKVDSPLRDAYEKHRRWRRILSIIGMCVSMVFLWLSVGEDTFLRKVLEALGSALLFASVSGLAVALLHKISMLETRELEILERRVYGHGE